MALRILAGASYWDVTLMFGLSIQATYDILWQVIDAINKTPAVGAFYFPQTEDGCMRNANRFKVRKKRSPTVVVGCIFSWRYAEGVKSIVYVI